MGCRDVADGDDVVIALPSRSAGFAYLRFRRADGKGAFPPNQYPPKIGTRMGTRERQGLAVWVKKVQRVDSNRRTYTSLHVSAVQALKLAQVPDPLQRDALGPRRVR